MKRMVLLIQLVAFATPTLAAAADADAERDTWRSEIAAARARAEAQRNALRTEFERRKTERLLHPPPAEDLERERACWASEQVKGDSSLQKGDIVSTVDGLFVFVGDPNGERTPTDFVPLPR